MQPANKNVDKQKIAHILANHFNDNQNLNRYLTYCKKYELSVINRAFNDVKNSEEQLGKLSNTLFFYLVKKYAHQA